MNRLSRNSGVIEKSSLILGSLSVDTPDCILRRSFHRRGHCERVEAAGLRIKCPDSTASAHSAASAVKLTTGRTMRHSREPLVLLALTLMAGLAQHLLAAANPSPEERDRQQLQQSVDKLATAIKTDSENDDLYSQRGDALFFLGDFKEAVADYDKMVALETRPRRLALAPASLTSTPGGYADAAAQFDRYHSFDNVDRENGIWRLPVPVDGQRPRRSSERTPAAPREGRSRAVRRRLPTLRRQDHARSDPRPYRRREDRRS
ncbi:MAG: hypothetical protein U0992_05245 [Planctomycetaceae bacterium]